MYGIYHYVQWYDVYYGWSDKVYIYPKQNMYGYSVEWYNTFQFA